MWLGTKNELLVCGPRLHQGLEWFQYQQSADCWPQTEVGWGSVQEGEAESLPPLRTLNLTLELPGMGEKRLPLCGKAGHRLIPLETLNPVLGISG